MLFWRLQNSSHVIQDLAHKTYTSSQLKQWPSTGSMIPASLHLCFQGVSTLVLKQESQRMVLGCFAGREDAIDAASPDWRFLPLCLAILAEDITGKRGPVQGCWMHE